MQLRYQTGLTSEEYVSQQAWRDARLERCPLHPKGGCGFSRHGTYGRKSPAGVRVARWYCRKGQTTFSLLPDFLASRLPGTLEELEAVVEKVEVSPSVQLAVEPKPSLDDDCRERLRPDIDLLGALRWTRRRVRLVHAALTALVGLFPELFAGCQPTIISFRRVLAEPSVLVALREIAASHLAALPPPLGFGPRPRPRRRVRTRHQHDQGPDPPARSR